MARSSGILTQSLLLACALLSLAKCSLVQDVDKCTLWLKTDGTNCQPSTPISLHKLFLGNVPALISQKVCCSDGTGCFSVDKDTPWECYNDLPECMDQVQPRFLFYTPEHNQRVQIIDYFKLNDSVKKLTTSKVVRPFFVIVHGFGVDWPKPWMFNLKDRLNALGNNVMIVRWTEGSKEPWYFQSASNTRTVGAAVALVMKSLNSNGKISIKNSTIIGFSLGGQVAGYAGSNLPRLRRILAIDPAGPMFQCMQPAARLDALDAQFVQAIHTNGDYFMFGGCGTHQRFGHMDVYINGGTLQPGCPRGAAQPITDLALLNFSAMIESVSCSHNRVPKLLVEMVANAADPTNHCQMMSFPCDSEEEWRSGACFQCPENGCPVAGYLTDLDNHQTGTFYVNTLGENITTGQYCGRQFLLSLTSDITVKGKLLVNLKSGALHTGPILIQDVSDVMIGETAKSTVVVVPWNMTKIHEIEIIYSRNQLLFTQGPTSWTLNSVIVQHINGSRLTNQEAVQIIDEIPNTVQFGTYDEYFTPNSD